LGNQFYLPAEEPVLACGAWLKNTVCVVHKNRAQVSPLIGDLASIEARRMLDETVTQMCEGVPIAIVAHDLHPDFYSTQVALAFAAQRGIAALAVQHHHAHIAAVCAEHGYFQPVLGLALDGVGLGTDGTPWGGELLKVEGAHFQRMGHLAHIGLPGGDRAAREPWRMAAAVLFQLGRGSEIVSRFPGQPAALTVTAMLQRNLNCTMTSSMGRLFDAAAGLLAVNEIQDFEAQAALLLQELAREHGETPPLPGGYYLSATGVLNFLPLLSVLADCRDAAYGAALFHSTISAGLAVWAERACSESKIDHIVLGGGCFYNDILLGNLTDRLNRAGLHVLSTNQPGDSLISLGQAWIALQVIKQQGI
jgi:hydrogenase maturation protein HypF